MAYSTVLNSSSSGDPIAAIAFMSDGAEVISLDPDMDEAVDSIQDRFNRRIDKVRSKNAGAELNADDVVDACLSNTISFTGPLEHHRTDDEAYDAIHELRGTYDRINRAVSPNG